MLDCSIDQFIDDSVEMFLFKIIISHQLLAVDIGTIKPDDSFRLVDVDPDFRIDRHIDRGEGGVLLNHTGYYKNQGEGQCQRRYPKELSQLLKDSGWFDPFRDVHCNDPVDLLTHLIIQVGTLDKTAHIIQYDGIAEMCFHN